MELLPEIVVGKAKSSRGLFLFRPAISNSFKCSLFHKHLLSCYCILDTVLNAWTGFEEYKTWSLAQGVHRIMGKTLKKEKQ
jgi:hypothetical protein